MIVHLYIKGHHAHQIYHFQQRDPLKKSHKAMLQYKFRVIKTVRLSQFPYKCRTLRERTKMHVWI